MSGTVPYSVPLATTHDNCSNTLEGSTTSSLTFDTPGDYTINWTFTDLAGNSSFANQKLILTSTTSPTVTPPITPTTPVDTESKDSIPPVPPILMPIRSQCGISVAVPSALDATDGIVLGTTDDPLDYELQGDFIINWIFSDKSGNSTTTQQFIYINDDIPPTVPDIPSMSSSCSITITQVPVAIDNCAGVITGTTTDPLTYHIPGNYTINWIFSDGYGNRSFATQNLSVTPKDELVDTQISCNAFTWINSVTYTQSNNTATFETFDAAGCTILNRLDLMLIKPDLTVDLVGNTLRANQDGATYQWIDCDNGMLPIEGATGQSFTPTVNEGNYAVEISFLDCVQISSCTQVSIIQTPSDTSVDFYPNPTSGRVNLVLGDELTNVVLRILDFQGRVIQSIKVPDGDQKPSIDIQGVNGAYIIEVISDQKTESFSILKQ